MGVVGWGYVTVVGDVITVIDYVENKIAFKYSFNGELYFNENIYLNI